MHHHLEECDGGDSYILKMVGIGLPWLCIADDFLFRSIVGIERIFLRVDELDVIVQLCLSRSALNQTREFSGRNMSLPQVLNALSMTTEQ